MAPATPCLLASDLRSMDNRLGFGAIPEGDEAFARILAIADHPPNDDGAHLDDLGSYHPGGTSFAYVDGSNPHHHRDD